MVPAPPEAITGIPAREETAAVQLQIVPALGAIAVHAGEQNLPRAQPLRLGGPFQRIQTGAQPSTVFIYVPAAPPPAAGRRWPPPRTGYKAGAASDIRAGRSMAAELIEILSAP